MIKKISYFLICLLVPTVIVGGFLLFREKGYAWISLCVVVFSCTALLLSFENDKQAVELLLMVAVMVALAVVGRILFQPLPSFKPVAAVVAVTGMYLGARAGFITGALAAVISNFYFGQGAWTPFQMFAWGMVGLLAGLLAKPLRRSVVAQILFGAASGALFSLLMDVYSVLWFDNAWHLARYLAFVSTSLPVIVTYMVSNVVFLLVLTKPIGKIFRRLQVKYGIGEKR